MELSGGAPGIAHYGAEKPRMGNPFGKIGSFRTPGLPRPGAEGKPKIRRLIERGFPGNAGSGLSTPHEPSMLRAGRTPKL